MDLPWYAKFTGLTVLAMALFMAFPGERDLALLAGWGEHYAWAMPAILSAYAAVAAVIAANRPKGRLGYLSSRIGAVAALFLAMAAQITSHLISGGYLETSAFLVAAVSSVPPIVAVHVGHLLITPRTLSTAPERAEEKSQEKKPENTSQKATEAIERPSSRGARPKASVREIRAVARHYQSQGKKVTGRLLAEHFGVSVRTGSRYLSHI